MRINFLSEASILSLFLPLLGMFTKKNYQLLIIGILLIGLGYLLMMGGESKDPKVFSEEIFSFRRITLAPIVIVSGFIVVMISIMWKDKNQEAN